MVLDILAATYLDMGLLENALDMALEADREKESDGAVLLVFADRVMDRSQAVPRSERRRCLDLGVRALDAFTANHPRRDGNDRAKYMLAGIFAQFGSGDVTGFPAAERRGYLDRAVEQYTEVSRRYSSSEYAELADLERGDLLLFALKQPEKALETYKIGAVNSRNYGDLFAARIARVYLGLGDFDNAQHYFEALVRSGVAELVQAGTYYSGLMLALQGEYETARDTLTYLAEADPSSPYTNDAIETAWIVEEGLTNQSKSLGVFLKAIQAEFVGDTASVIGELNKIVSGPVYDVMRPRAQFKLGTTLYETGDLDGAVSHLRRFLDEYPSSSLRPDVQRTIASVYEFGYEQYQQALREYEVVLMLYPDYAFLDEVRKDVRRLRFIVEGEE
jgi:tetratricopeptide (TPR) repeat protein